MDRYVIGFLALSIALLFTSMVLSSMSASAIKQGDLMSAHKYATWSAVVCGLSVLLLIAVMVIYINRGSVAGRLRSWL